MTPDEEILDRLARIEMAVQHLEVRLFGDGQPGTLSRLHDRVYRLERYLWMSLGAVAVFGAIAGSVAAKWFK